MRLRSYARAFPRDRRIYRIDRWAIPIPGGLPLAASAWFVGLAVGLVALAQLPAIGAVASIVGWPATVIIGPGAGALALTRTLDDGRSVPAHAWCAARYRIAHLPSRARARACTRVLWIFGDHTLAPRVRIHGPGRLAVAGSVDLTQRSARIIVATISAVTGRAPQVVALAESQVLEVRT